MFKKKKNIGHLLVISVVVLEVLIEVLKVMVEVFVVVIVEIEVG